MALLLLCRHSEPYPDMNQACLSLDPYSKDQNVPAHRDRTDRTDEFKKKAPNYCTRFGHSLWSVHQVASASVVLPFCPITHDYCSGAEQSTSARTLRLGSWNAVTCRESPDAMARAYLWDLYPSLRGRDGAFQEPLLKSKQRASWLAPRSHVDTLCLTIKVSPPNT
ncbi:hypothetical protein WN51_06532 [Melipona quadrifasciata]|uniref:Uncharacterized protein n=1 Tax=Melipona quadrifasciata TaxID=166423 RepID=A0A0M8ZTH0_9HYME|nr:hypothetical protein WN51_06532 [Melipona quadrifasciata]